MKSIRGSDAVRAALKELSLKETALARESMDKWRIESAGGACLIMIDPSEASERRCAAAGILATLRGPHALPDLLTAFGSADEPLAFSIANILARLRSFQATRQLIRYAKRDAPSHLRKAAIYALGQLGDARAARALVHILLSEAEDEPTRALAADELGVFIRKRFVLKALLGVHNHASVEIRFSVVNSLLRHKENQRVYAALSEHFLDKGQIPERPPIDELVRLHLGHEQR